jgi:hypothetical protein
MPAQIGVAETMGSWGDAKPHVQKGHEHDYDAPRDFIKLNKYTFRTLNTHTVPNNLTRHKTATPSTNTNHRPFALGTRR